MDIKQIKLRVANEMSLVTSQVSEKYDRVQSEKGSQRFNFLAAQAALCMYFMKTMTDRNDDWGWFPDLLKAHREQALFEYRQARIANDRHEALLMLARLRLMTTLARRIANRERANLFLNEKSDEVLHEENLWVEELTLTNEEAMATVQRLESHGNPALQRAALSQFFLARAMLKQVIDSEDWSWFKESVYEYIDSETARYRESRAAGNRDEASIMLARVRFATTLARP